MVPPPPPAAQLSDNQPSSTTAEGSSTNSSPSLLPYLRDSSPSPHTTVNSGVNEPKVPGPRAGPSLLSLSNPPISSTPSSATSSTSSKAKKRPKPLVLGRQEVGQDEELTAQLRTDGRWSARSGITIVSPHTPDEISKQISELSILRKDVDANLSQRPLDISPTVSSYSSAQTSPLTGPTLPEEDQVAISDIKPDETLIIDTRSLGAYLTSHLPRSVNINIPTLIYKRLKRSRGSGATAETLGSYITTSAGRAAWEDFTERPDQDLVIIGALEEDEAAMVYKGIMDKIATPERVKVLKGGWGAIMASDAKSSLVSGDDAPAATSSASTSSTPFTGPIPTFNIAPPPHPDSHSQMLSQKKSMPSLRAGIKRSNVPSLSIQVDPRRPGQLSQAPKTASPSGGGKFPNLHLDIAAAKGGQPSLAPKSPGRSPIRGSFQQACLEQSKLPPSPSSFADITLPTPGPVWPQRSPGGQEYGFAGPSRTGPARNAVAPFIVSTILPSFLYLGAEISSKEEIEELKKMGVKRVLNVAMECEDNQGLGLVKEFEKYHKIPMRVIVEETGVNKCMREACDFLNDARLHSAPVYVHCKAGKSRSVTVVIAYLIHANAWTLKTAYAYVAEHRKGISPNIGFVAELMQFEETELGLKQSAGLNGDVPQPDDNDAGSSETGGKAKEPSPRKQKAKYSRESLPPAWAIGSASLGNTSAPRLLVNNNDVSPTDDGPRRGSQADMAERGKDRKVSDEREVRKDGHWVQQRRAPVDRLTLQPGRRASKAGLESLRHPNQDLIAGRDVPVSHDMDDDNDAGNPARKDDEGEAGSHSAILVHHDHRLGFW